MCIKRMIVLKTHIPEINFVSKTAKVITIFEYVFNSVTVASEIQQQNPDLLRFADW